MRAYYSEKEERRYGVVGIKFVVINEKTRWLNMDQQYDTHILFPAESHGLQAIFSLNIPLGLDELGNEILCDFEKTGCMWVEGNIGTGKTTFCKNIIWSIVRRYGAAFDFYIHDTSHRDYDTLREEMIIPGLDAEHQPKLEMISDHACMLQFMKNEMDRRWQMLEQAERIRPLEKWLRWKDFLWNRAFFIFDQFEPSQFSNNEKELFLASVRTLYRFCDRLGVHMLVVTKTPSASEAEDIMRLESKARIYMRTPRPDLFSWPDYWSNSEKELAKSLKLGEFIYSMPPHYTSPRPNSGKGTFAV